MVLECDTKADVVVGIVWIVVVTDRCWIVRPRIVVIASSVNTIVGVVSFSVYPYFNHFSIKNSFSNKLLTLAYLIYPI